MVASDALGMEVHKDGIFALKPVMMRLFGGQGSGSIGVDFSNPVPRYSVRSTLSMRGNTAKEIKQTADGEVSLSGENLTLYGNDLDREFARFESSQNFNLVDAGALFFAGPIGLAVTKGYNFASIFQRSGGSSIGKLFSDWNVDRGIAQAKDVAMATKQNRIALIGRINFVNEHYDDVTIALIDAQGCTRVQQNQALPLLPILSPETVLIPGSGFGSLTIRSPRPR